VPERWELGTLPFESLAGVRAAANFVARLDREELRAHEDRLLAQMVEGLSALGGVTVHGAARDRTATVMFTVAGHSSHDVAAHLARAEVAVWHGNYYALELSRWLGLEPDGALRAGVVAYNDGDEVDRLLEAVAELTS
jgi:selenocysteine lyase/cysteine desulfurase